MCGRWGRVMSACSVEVERGPDRLHERGFLFCQKEAQLAPERTHGHRDDVVAADNAVVIEPVGWAHRNLRGQAAHGAGDGRDGDPAEVGAHDLTGEDQHRSCLVQARGVNGSHQSRSSIAVAAAYSARLSRSVSVPARARMAASRSATLRRRSRSRARDTTAARLVASPWLTRSSLTPSTYPANLSRRNRRRPQRSRRSAARAKTSQRFPTGSIPATSTALICANAGQVTPTRRPLATDGGLGVSVTRLAGHPKQPAYISRRFRQELHEGEVSGTPLAWSASASRSS